MKSQNSQPKQAENFHDWTAELGQESSIHGVPYMARRDLHWTERLFWMAIVLASAYYAINSCLAQWDRFRENPIVYEYEYLFALRNFTFLGLTLCTSFSDEKSMEQVINQWVVA